MTDDIKAIRDALAAGPTPGPWIDDRHATAVYPWTEVKAPEHPGRGVVAHVMLSDVASFSCTIGKAEQEWVNAAYIAAVHPERITRLLDALEAAQAALKRIAELDPGIHSEEGYNEWGETDCFRQSQQIARAAMKGGA